MSTGVKIFGDKILDKLVTYLKISANKLANELGYTHNTIIYHVKNGRNNISHELANRIVTRFPEINYNWLMTGEGEMIIKNEVKEYPVDTNVMTVHEPFEVFVIENNNSNTFMRLENGQYLMTMPLAEYHIQAGFLDHYQDIDFLKDMDKHSIIVENPLKGRYVAFRVKGDSMDNGRSDAITQNSIVATRELQRQHWTSSIRFRDFPYWVIYTTQATFPLLKEMVAHDVEKGIITCHSLNDSPEYTDFELSLNDVKALFYVVNVQKDIAIKDYY